MSELSSTNVVHETEAFAAIAAAVAEGARAEPQLAAGKVIDSLRAAFGPIVPKIIALIEAGANNLPAVLDALKAAGVALPPWASLVATILIAVTKQQ